MNTVPEVTRETRAYRIAADILHLQKPFETISYHDLAIALREELDPIYRATGKVDDEGETWEWYFDYARYFIALWRNQQATLYAPVTLPTKADTEQLTEYLRGLRHEA